MIHGTYLCVWCVCVCVCVCVYVCMCEELLGELFLKKTQNFYFLKWEKLMWFLRRGVLKCLQFSKRFFVNVKIFKLGIFGGNLGFLSGTQKN